MQWLLTSRMLAILLCFDLVISCSAHSEGPDDVIPKIGNAPINTRAELFCEWGLLIPVTLNGAGPFWMIVDSGAGISSLSTRAAHDINLRLGLVRTSTGAGNNTYNVYSIFPPKVETAGVAVDIKPAAAADLQPTEEVAGRRLDGILGHDLFQSYVVDIDYAGRRITLHDPDHFSYRGAGAILPIEERNHHLFTTAIFDQDGSSPRRLRILLDTGGFGVPLLLNTPFVKANRLALPGMLESSSGIGQGGVVHALFTRARNFQLGPFSMHNIIVALSQDERGALASREYDGIVGGEVLHRFRVIFDLRHHQLILEPNSQLDQPFDSDHSGIALRIAGTDTDRVEIYDVLARSPGANVGITAGDYLRAVDGVSVSHFSLDELRRMLRDGTRSFQLTIGHRGKVRTVTLKLRELV